jgi:succinyl-CoA synthetase beta subunit
MKLMEYQGATLFRACGLHVPDATILRPGDDYSLVPCPVILKAQVLSGGRGKAGGVRLVTTRETIGPTLDSLFALQIKGEPVTAVMAVEPCNNIQREIYLSITFTGSSGEPMLLASASGGMEVENSARSESGRMLMLSLHPHVGITPFHARYLARKLHLEDYTELLGVLQSLYRAFVEYDATLVEINPLALTPDGLIALDAKVVLDDNAKKRHGDLFERLTAEQGTVAEKQREDTITFVGMQGYVGLISDGAGTGMLTLDLLNEAGTPVNSFCELGGVTNPDVMYTALRETLTYPGAKSLLIVLIGGFNRMDHMAQGIRRYMEERALDIPMVVRMCGSKEEEGKKILREIGVSTVDDLGQAVLEAVRLAKEG